MRRRGPRSIKARPHYDAGMRLRAEPAPGPSMFAWCRHVFRQVTPTPHRAKSLVAPAGESSVGREPATEVGTMKKIAAAIALALTMTAIPALAQKSLLE